MISSKHTQRKMTFEKLVVIDARGHLMGRLASSIAKQLLSGQRIVVVRAELVEISGASTYPFLAILIGA